jgi:hypothetical protein
MGYTTIHGDLSRDNDDWPVNQGSKQNLEAKYRLITNEEKLNQY